MDGACGRSGQSPTMPPHFEDSGVCYQLQLTLRFQPWLIILEKYLALSSPPRLVVRRAMFCCCSGVL